MSSSDQIDVPAWVPPTPSARDDLDWAPLHTLDLSLVQGEEFDQVPEHVVKEVGEAFSRDGFIYVENHGLSYEQVLRQFSIGQFAFNNVNDEEKQRCVADMLQSGSFVGYKPVSYTHLTLPTILLV